MTRKDSILGGGEGPHVIPVSRVPGSALLLMKELISVLAVASSLCKELSASASEQKLEY
jgi:hypothetical protein